MVSETVPWEVDRDRDEVYPPCPWPQAFGAKNTNSAFGPGAPIPAVVVVEDACRKDRQRTRNAWPRARAEGQGDGTATAGDATILLTRRKRWPRRLGLGTIAAVPTLHVRAG